MKKFPFKTFAQIIYFSIIILVFVDLFIYDSFENFLYEEIHQDLAKKVSLARRQLDINKFEKKATKDLKYFVDEIKTVTDLRLTLIDKQGRVLADSDVPLDDLENVENHILRDEIQDALKRGFGIASRTSATIDSRLLYYCETLTKEGRVIGFIRLAMFKPELNAKLAFAKSMLWKIDLIVLVLITLALLFNNLQFKRTLKKIRTDLIGKRDRGFFDTISNSLDDHLNQFGSEIKYFTKKLQEDSQKIASNNHQILDIFNSMSEGVAAFDSEGKAIIFNKPFCTILKVDEEEIQDKPFYSWLHFPPLIQDIKSFQSSASKDGLKNQTKYYGHISIEYQILPLKAEDGKIKEFIVTLKDVSLIQKLERIRQDFVANVSHEFKTPLSSIRGYAETLLSGAVDESETQNRFLTKIEKQTIRLERMVTDLLQLSRVEKREVNDLKVLNLLPVVQDIVEDYEAIAKTSQKYLDLKYDNKLAAISIFANEELLHTLFSNILNNAFQYSHENGTIRINIEQGEQNSVIIKIADDGIGIEASQLNRIFERFYRTEDAREIYANGTGLGLSIVRNIVSHLKGKVEVQSTPNVGSVFSIELPIRE